MRTLFILAAGFVFLGISLLLESPTGSRSRAALTFIGLWLALTIANGAFGVLKAGYGVGEEFPIFLVIFIPPAATALFIRRRFTVR